MFKRILLEEWHVIIPLISLGTLAAIFIYATYKTLRMKQERIDHLANLPLEDTEADPESPPKGKNNE